MEPQIDWQAPPPDQAAPGRKQMLASGGLLPRNQPSPFQASAPTHSPFSMHPNHVGISHAPQPVLHLGNQV